MMLNPTRVLTLVDLSLLGLEYTMKEQHLKEEEESPKSDQFQNNLLQINRKIGYIEVGSYMLMNFLGW